jgi:probable HAF family extracellular repeat protein
MMTQQRLLAAVALGLILAVPGPAQAQYKFTTIDVPGAVRTAVNRNTSNALAGEFDTIIDDDYDAQTHGFVFTKGVFTTIDVPGSTFTTVYGINPRGEICGYFTGEDDVTHGFFRNQKGVFTTIDPPGSVHTFADGLNAHGEVVGVYRDDADTRHGFLWSDGVYTLLDDVPGAGGRNGGTIPLGINDHGDIVGDYTTSTDGRTLTRHGFVQRDGVYTTLDVQGALLTVATGINNDGVIVGAYLEEHVLHLPPYGDFLLQFQHGYVLIDGVYTTINVGRPYHTAVLTINAEGQIAGYYVNGVTHGFVGTPVDN